MWVAGEFDAVDGGAGDWLVQTGWGGDEGDS